MQCAHRTQALAGFSKRGWKELRAHPSGERLLLMTKAPPEGTPWAKSRKRAPVSFRSGEIDERVTSRAARTVRAPTGTNRRAPARGGQD